MFSIGGVTRPLSSLVSFCDELGDGVRVMGAMRQKRIDSEDKVRESEVLDGTVQTHR